LASKVLADFPKVNLVSILAGAIALISIFLPWWGMDGTAFGFSGSIIRWSLWSRPFVGDTSSSQALAEAAQTMGVLSILVLAIAFITVALAFLGSFDPGKEYLALGFVSTILAIAVYAGSVSYTLSNMCQGSPTCPSGPIGSAFASGASVTWGFQAGFYLFLVGGILLVFAVIFHQTFLQRKGVVAQPVSSRNAKFCSSCGNPVEVDAKFCSHCAHAIPS
jgi:Amastin surface glycoprotein/zinc-ribbon domain